MSTVARLSIITGASTGGAVVGYGAFVAGTAVSGWARLTSIAAGVSYGPAGLCIAAACVATGILVGWGISYFMTKSNRSIHGAKKIVMEIM